MTLTKKDFTGLRSIFATKDDLKGFATKNDLKRFATKEDLKRFATKNDLTKVRSDLMNALDKILKELVASRETQEMMGHRVFEHEERITVLEKIHPQIQTA